MQITVEKIYKGTSKKQKPFLKINDTYWVWDSQLFHAFVEGAQLEAEVDGDKFPQITSVGALDARETTTQTFAKGLEAVQQYYNPEASKQESIETQVAVKALVDLKVAGKLDGELEAAWPSAVRWLYARLVPEGAGSVEVVDTKMASLVKQFREIAKKEGVKWGYLLKAKYPEDYETATLAAVMEHLGPEKCEVVLLEHTAQQEMK